MNAAHAPQHARPEGHVAFRVSDASLHVGRHWIFRDVQLAIPPLGVAAVVGPSGSGKTSLLLALAGRMRLTAGTIDVGSHRLNAPKPTNAEFREVRKVVAIARIADSVGLDPELTLHHNISDAADWVGVKRAVAHAHVEEWWDRLGFTYSGDVRLSEMHALEATAAHLVLATLGNPQAIVMDDVSSDLQIAERRRIWEIVRDVASSGPVVVCTTLDELTLDADVVIHLTAHQPRHAHKENDLPEEGLEPEETHLFAPAAAAAETAVLEQTEPTPTEPTPAEPTPAEPVAEEETEPPAVVHPAEPDPDPDPDPAPDTAHHGRHSAPEESR